MENKAPQDCEGSLSPPLWAATTAQDAGAPGLLLLQRRCSQGGPEAAGLGELSLKAFLAREQEPGQGVPAGRLLLSPNAGLVRGSQRLSVGSSGAAEPGDCGGARGEGRPGALATCLGRGRRTAHGRPPSPQQNAISQLFGG